VLLHIDVAFRTLEPANGAAASQSHTSGAERPVQLNGGMLAVRLSACVEPPKQSKRRAAGVSRASPSVSPRARSTWPRYMLTAWSERS
jgi:hypothetical protein